MVASHALPTGDLACNPGMCPHWGLNQQPFGSQASTQSTGPHQPGWNFFFTIMLMNEASFCKNYYSSLFFPKQIVKLIDLLNNYTHRETIIQDILDNFLMRVQRHSLAVIWPLAQSPQEWFLSAEEQKDLPTLFF